jgi:hypothetical protein
MKKNGAMIFADKSTCDRAYTSGPHRTYIIEHLPRQARPGDNTKLHNDPHACFAATA